MNAAIIASSLSSGFLFTLVRRTFAFSSVPPMYPRPLHPGSFFLPPMVEDLIPIITTIPAASAFSSTATSRDILQKGLLIVRPPDMESLWEWYAYTKRQTDSDPSWGRIWPTALSLARFTLQSLNSNNSNDNDYGVNIAAELEEQEQALFHQAVQALQRTSHIIELGCGLGVVGLAFAASVETESINIKRTITFLDREQYALHCVMASAAINNLATAPIASEKVASEISQHTITVRSAIDDWTSSDKNISYKDLQLDALDYDNKQTLILASDILYEPSSMDLLTTKLRNLLHPQDGGYVLITDPEKERTSGCRTSFVQSVKVMGGQVVTLLLPQLESNCIESDADTDENLANTVLIVVHFNG